MPAVTADTLTLPRITLPLDSRSRQVRSVTTAPGGFEGEGFPVRRAFAGVTPADLDPFIHMDQMGEVDYAPYEPRGTDWHPHRGFETVTYIIDGTFVHQDSHGGGGTITNGGTQWMTAGGGILHIETPPEELVVSGGLFHGVQLWVNLPASDKLIAPRYQNLDAELVTLLSSPDGGALVRLIAGDIGGHRGPGGTHTPITVSHATVAPGARLEVPWPKDFNALAYVLAGRGTVGTDERPVEVGQLVVFGAGDHLTVRAAEAAGGPLELLLLGGRPLREPVAAYGPFVMNTHAEIQQAMADFQAGKLGTVPADGIRPYAAVADMTSTTMPAVFVGHGSPMNALQTNRYTEAWHAFGASVPRPRAVLAVSAHWFINATAVTAMAQPKTIHDFFGFPDELFAFQYPAPGDPALVEEIVDTVKPTWVGHDVDSWGLDHGTWSVLAHMFPEAELPVVQLSVDASKPFDYHVALGAQLAPLRERGVLVVASGNVVHNLRALDWNRRDEGFDWAHAFDDRARELMTTAPGDVASLQGHEAFALASPTPDHLLPLAYVAGLADAAGANAEVVIDGYAMGSLSMTAYRVD